MSRRGPLCLAVASFFVASACRTRGAPVGAETSAAPATTDSSDDQGTAPATSASSDEPGAESDVAAEPSDAPAKDAPRELHGFVGTRYRGRWTEGEDDHDLYTLVELDWGDPTVHDVSAHLLAGASADLDGDRDPGGGSVFTSLDDTYEHALHADLYEARIDVRKEGFERVSIGRQLDYETPEVAWYDGVALESAERGKDKLQFGLYGGIPVHQYESSSDGDVLAGLYAEARPWKAGRARLDWMHLEDENILGPHEDDLFALSLWQQLGAHANLDATGSVLGGDARDLRLGGNWYDAQSDLVLRAQYYELFSTQGDLSIELDPFYTTLFELFPYRQVRLLASKGFGERWSVESGLELRRVSDEDDVAKFNRDFERAFATATWHKGLPLALAASVTADAWDGDGSDYSSLGAELSRAFDERAELALGTYGALYKYDVYLGDERDRVQSWYARLRRKTSERSSYDLRYDIEDDDDFRYHSLRVGFTWRF